MGIKGIYRELGPGTRISLLKLSISHLETHNRPLRLAIDFSIWSYQNAAAKGGTNPAIRTLFYRILRLLSLCIQPVFVFDGPDKPAFKRNKRTSGRNGDAVGSAMAKRLIGLFGLPWHQAPGEAEAECALLQQKGVVDCVLTEDVDTIMFGCTRTVRNWSANGNKGVGTPTHVSLYDAEEMKQSKTGLDRQGMILVALMSGGDYLPEGVPGCGVKVACEAARGGFGRSLCRVKRSDSQALTKWRDELLQELGTNESGYFRTKHKALDIPEDFPDMDILRYYTHPVVSQLETIEGLQRRMAVRKDIDVVGLRDFAAETFDWTNREGAIKLVRVLAPPLMVMKLQERMLAPTLTSAGNDMVNHITKDRKHDSTDATPELRVSYVPIDVVRLDLDAEQNDPINNASGRSGLALNSDEEEEPEAQVTDAAKKVYDPLVPDVTWLPTTLLKLSIPAVVEEFEAAQRAKLAAKLASPKKSRKPAAVQNGAIDKFFTVSKKIDSVRLPKPSTSLSPTVLLGSSAAQQQIRLSSTAVASGTKSDLPRALATSKSKQRPISNDKPPVSSRPPAPTSNPWTIASSQVSPTRRARKAFGRTATEPICLSSSPAAPTTPPRMPRLAEADSLCALKVTPVSLSPTRSKEGQMALQPKPRSTTLQRTQTAPAGRPRSPPEQEDQRRSKRRSPSVDKNLPAARLDVHDVFEAGSNSDDDFPDIAALSAPKVSARFASVLSEKSKPVKRAVAQKIVKSATTRVYVPRTSDIGFCGAIELDREAADSLRNDPAGLAKRLGINDTRARRAWRESDVHCVDLTGET